MNADQQRSDGKQSAIRQILLLFFLILMLPILLLFVLVWFLVCAVVLAFVWLTWLPRGKDMLLVYSNSPYWQEYFESGLLPLLGKRAQVLNWSDRSNWALASLKRVVFRLFSGPKEYNPVIIMFRPLRWPQKVKFYQAFRDLRHGNAATLISTELRLTELLDQPIEFSSFHPRPST